MPGRQVDNRQPAVAESRGGIAIGPRVIRAAMGNRARHAVQNRLRVPIRFSINVAGDAAHGLRRFTFQCTIGSLLCLPLRGPPLETADEQIAAVRCWYSTSS